MVKNNSALTPSTPVLKHIYPSSKFSDGKNKDKGKELPYFTRTPDDEIDRETLIHTSNPDKFILSPSNSKVHRPDHSFI